MPLPHQLHHDPLNLEGKIDNFESIMNDFHRTSCKRNSIDQPAGKKKRKIKRVESHSESSSNESRNPVNFTRKGSIYRYGNYTQYYGYRNKGPAHEDPRLKLFKRDWFEGRDCLDVGSNTGLVTIAVAKGFSPRAITGVDIDAKLIRMAWKNLHRQFVPMVTPSGRPFPVSFKMTHMVPVGGDKPSELFPNNVTFKQVDYVPRSDEEVSSVVPRYHLILCLSLTKWIHLNHGDEGLKRTFLKMYRQLHPGGYLILEPQPWSSYGKRKKLTPKIYENYQKITFKPDEFHSYLMSPAVGFSSHTFLGTPEAINPGFKRSVHLYIKGNPSEAINQESQAPPTNAETPPTNPSNTDICVTCND
jgi:7SK snRNA methylphosphate capping enzyme